MKEESRANVVLTANTLAFAVCFACWMINAVLITFLSTRGVFDWNSSQIGLLLATPVLTGSLLRLPVGMLTDRFGGRAIYTILMLVAAAALYMESYANSFAAFLAASLGFGLAGASFAVGVAYTSIWFKKERQGTALGIFGVGNAGTALTLLFAPKLLRFFTENGANMDGWRALPRFYAAVLIGTAIVFWLVTYSRKPAAASKTLRQRLAPLGQVRVWRFGAYYALLFGGFVALSNWLMPYYVKAYELDLVVAGLFATLFALPSGLSRALGGWLSDRFGARTVMHWVLSVCSLVTFALFFPKMDIITPGDGVLARAPGTIVEFSDRSMTVQRVGSEREDVYQLISESEPAGTHDRDFAFWPRSESRQSWAGKDLGESERPFRIGDSIAMRELIARGTTHIYFQANMYVFTALVIVLGLAMGIGMAAVFKHIPTYFPEDVGLVGGLVGVIGGLGGFFFPIIFGWLLRGTGIWTTCWVFLFLFSLGCLVWMRVVLRRMMQQHAPDLLEHFERHEGLTLRSTSVPGK